MHDKQFFVTLHCLLCMKSDSTSLKGILLSAVAGFFYFSTFAFVKGLFSV